METDLHLEKNTITFTNSQKFNCKEGLSARNNELHQKGALRQENSVFRSSPQEYVRWNDRLYLMQQESEQHRNEISRLRKAIDARKTTLLHKEHITRRNKALEENLLNVYETTTGSVTYLFGSIHEVYNSLRHAIDDNKDLDKAINEASNAIRETQKFCKKIDDLKQQNGFPWNIPDNSHNMCSQDKDENAMEIDVSNESNDDNITTSIDLKSLLERYNKTESLVDELANDLEQLESYKDEMILWKVSHAEKFQ